MGDDPAAVEAYIERSAAWPDELRAVRSILLDRGLTESIKWGKPCYSHDGKNLLILQEMKRFLALMFFKGALLEDSDGVLREQGPNSRSARRIEITSVDEVTRLASTIAAYVDEAVCVEELGLGVGPAPEPELAEELVAVLDADTALRAAFDELTPGRRREYNLHVTGAKRSATRTARAERCVERIRAGKGLRDR